MMNIIGLDAHSARFFMTAINSQGKTILCTDAETSPENLIAQVCRVNAPRELVVEESHLAQWVKTVLEPYVDRLVVCDPRHNRWIAKDDFCDDRRASAKLAELLRLGAIKEVKHPDDEGAILRSMFLHYNDLNVQITRIKNKIKAVFRGNGIAIKGRKVYSVKGRQEFIDKIASLPHLEMKLSHWYHVLDRLECSKRITTRKMTKIAKSNEGYRYILSVPGVGPVLATGYVAMIGTPYRFARKNKLWNYSGFGNVLHTSDNVVYRSGASSNGNRLLKWVVSENWSHCVGEGKDNMFSRRYKKVIDSGGDAAKARRLTCKLILNVIGAVWMNKTYYKEQMI